jgi:hypothetical protein
MINLKQFIRFLIITGILLVTEGGVAASADDPVTNSPGFQGVPNVACNEMARICDDGSVARVTSTCQFVCAEDKDKSLGVPTEQSGSREPANADSEDSSSGGESQR